MNPRQRPAFTLPVASQFGESTARITAARIGAARIIAGQPSVVPSGQPFVVPSVYDRRKPVWKQRNYGLEVV